MKNSRGNGERTFLEIAKLLGITSATVEVHYHRGMAKLRSRRLTPRFQKLMRLVENKHALAAARSASVLSCRPFE